MRFCHNDPTVTVKVKDRPKTGFTFTAENETTAESESSFSCGGMQRYSRWNRLPYFGRMYKTEIFSLNWTKFGQLILRKVIKILLPADVRFYG